MDVKELVSLFGNAGIMGTVAAVLFWQLSKLQDRLLQIVESNTKAFQELKAIIEKCQLTHKDDV